MFTELLDGLHAVGVEGELVAVVLALLIVLSALYLIYRLLPTRRLANEDNAPMPVAHPDPIANLAEAILAMTTAYNEGNEQSKLIVQGFTDMNVRITEMITLMTQQNNTLSGAIMEMHNTRTGRETQAGDTIANLMGIAKRQEHNIMPGIDATMGGIVEIRKDLVAIDTRITALPTADVIAAIQGELTLIRHRVDQVLEVLTLLETRPAELPEMPEGVPLAPEVSADPTAQAETITEEKR
jgi:hypothetical protein